MRKFYLFCSVFVLMTSGCSQNEVFDVQDDCFDDVKFTASFEQTSSRTYVEEGNLLRWTKGDLISLFKSNTFNEKYCFDGETGDNSGTFSIIEDSIFGTGNELNCNYAVYPYDEAHSISESGVIATILPSEQSYAENSFGLGDNTMVAMTQNTDDTFLNFKNVGGYLKLQLYGDDITVKTITLKGNSNEKISGKFYITPNYNNAPSVSMGSDAVETITIDCGEGVKIGTTSETATSFWFVVPPTVFEQGFTVNVVDASNNEFVKTTNNEVAIERNVIKPMAPIEVVITKTQALPDLSGVWYMSMVQDEYAIQTLTLDSSTEDYATYDATGYGVNEVGVFVRRDDSGNITGWVRICNPYGCSSYEEGTFNDDYTELRGTKLILSSGTVIEGNWYMSRYSAD